MFKKFFVVCVFLALTANNVVFSQSVAIDVAILNASKDIAGSVPGGTKIAVLNISSDYEKLSDYIIDELIANLVQTRLFQVVPRSTVELELARGELDFQYTGDVSDDSQRRLGQFLGADTIISGTVSRVSANSYRLVINTIDLESFTYQSTYRISIQNDNQVKALITSSGGVFYEDYTTGERLGIGALNIFGGAGSIMKGERIGWVTTGIEAAGIVTLLIGLFFNVPDEPAMWGDSSGNYYYDDPNEGRRYEDTVKTKEGFIIAGSAIIGAGVVFGFIIPFFHHKPDNTNIAQNNFPFNLELVSANHEINGVKISYNMRF